MNKLWGTVANAFEKLDRIISTCYFLWKQSKIKEDNITSLVVVLFPVRNPCCRGMRIWLSIGSA